MMNSKFGSAYNRLTAPNTSINHSASHVTIKNGKEENGMSFCIATMNERQIILSTDSRLTRTKNGNVFYDDKHKKIFVNRSQKIIYGIVGLNDFDGIEYPKIFDTIMKMESATLPRKIDCIKSFASLALEKYRNRTFKHQRFDMLVGYFDGNTPNVLIVEIDDNMPDDNSCIENYSYNGSVGSCWCGVDLSSKEYDEHINESDFLSSNSDELKIKNTIDLFQYVKNLKSSRNTVGGAVATAILSKDGIKTYVNGKEMDLDSYYRQ